MARDEPYANVRELVPLEGQRVVMVSQHDEVDWLCGLPAHVSLHFENGWTLKVCILADGVLLMEPPRD